MGTAVPAAAAGRWCITNDTLQFGNQPVGSSSTRHVTVSNCGDAAWSFTDVSVHPATGPAYHLDTTCRTGLSLGAGQACTVDVEFAPLLAGQTSGALWLRNTTSTPTQLLTFYGRGVDAQAATAQLVFNPATASFPGQEIGRSSDVMTIELQNLGPATITPSAMVLNGPDVYDYLGYPITCHVGAPIPAGQLCTIALYFNPQAAGARRANLVIDAPELASLAILQIVGVGAVAVAAADPLPTAIPALSDAGIAALAALIAGAALLALRRR